MCTYIAVSVCVWFMQVQGMVDSYKGANLDIANVGKGISELLLVHIDSHRVYENLEFEEDQVFHFTTLPVCDEHIL